MVPYVMASSQATVYNIPGVGTFNTLLHADFTALSSLPDELRVATYTVTAGRCPYARQFTKDNVFINNGSSLSLLVPGGQTVSPITSASISTVYKDILYGSVRTIAKVATAPGSCHGFFFYLNDNQESDIEILTSRAGKVYFTNQAVNSTCTKSTVVSSLPANYTSEFHEYRLDWVEGKTDFYIDSILVQTFTENVPSSPGSWLWNNWSNGGVWTSGPPIDTSNLEIREITAYFNRTSLESATSSASHSATSETSSISHHSSMTSTSASRKTSSTDTMSSTLAKSITSSRTSSHKSTASHTKIKAIHKSSTSLSKSQTTHKPTTTLEKTTKIHIPTTTHKNIKSTRKATTSHKITTTTCLRKTNSIAKIHTVT